VEGNLGAGLKKKLVSGAVVELLSSKGDVVDVARLTLHTMTMDLVGLGHHLDIVVEKVAGGLCQVHGVLGQTYKGLEYINGAITEAEIKVAAAKKFSVAQKNHPENDYEVSSTFATDDVFSSYGKDCESTAVSSVSRKLMSLHSGAYSVCAGSMVDDAICRFLHQL
jgi:hypothetical protein